MSEEKIAEVETAATPEVEAAAAPDLSINDLQSIKSIIDVASQRGAFKPSEMAVVGTTYNKLETFLAAVAQSQPKGE
jgi:hypothetical protein